MNTVLFKIGKLEAGHYKLSFYTDAFPVPDGQTRPWSEVPVAEAAIPAEELADAADGSAWSTQKVGAAILSGQGKKAEANGIGAWLFALLSRGEVAVWWEKVRAKFQAADLRYFFDVEPEALQRLPWELMYLHPKHLFQRFAMCRGRIDFSAMPPEGVWPLRILIVVGSEEGDQRVNVKAEVEGIVTALRKSCSAVFWEILKNPSRERLAKELVDFRPHVLHFIGHGRPATDDLGAHLEIFDPIRGEIWGWTTDQIDAYLHPTKPPRLVFLNACHSAGGPAEQAAAWSITRAFLERVPAVLGMQAAVDGAAAAAFARHFYGKLVDDGGLEAALAAARSQTANVDFPNLPDWGYGTLTVKMPPEQVLSLQPKLTLEERRQIARAVKLTERFVGRKTERRAVWERFDPGTVRRSGGNLLFVEGEEDVGTTEFILCCVGCCALRGANFVKIHFDKQRSTDFLQVMRLTRNGIAEAAQIFRNRLKCEAFTRFNYVLKYAIDGAPAPAPGTELPQVQDDGRPWAGGDERRIREVFAAFGQALSDVAGDVHPLILIFDGLQIAPGSEKYLRDYFLKRLADRSIANVHVIIELKKGQWEKYEFNHLDIDMDRPVDIPLFPRESFRDLVYEYIGYDTPPATEDDRQIVEAYINKISTGRQGWVPGKLERLRELILS